MKDERGEVIRFGQMSSTDIEWAPDISKVRQPSSLISGFRALELLTYVFLAITK